jgi:hypothetical protein
MKLETIKKAEQINLQGITAEAEILDGNVKAYHLTDAAGRRVTFTDNGYCGVRALHPAPPKLVKRWQLAGEFRGLKVCEAFESEPEARERRNAIEDYPSTPELTITAVEVPEA